MGSGIDKGAGRAWHIGVRVTKVPDSGAKKKLLDAAESLVAAKGFDSVSVRDVTGAAGANVAAVNYHFGSREGLMDVVIARILDPLCEARKYALEAAGKSAEALVRAYVEALSQVAAAITMDGRIFPKLAGRILALPDEAMPPVLATARLEVSGLYLAAIPKVRPSDWVFFEAGLAQSLIGVADSGDMAALLEDWIAFGVRGFSVAGIAKKKNDDAQGFLFEL